MLNLMYEMVKLDTTKKKLKKEKLMYDLNGNIIIAPKHRSQFSRFKRSFVYTVDPDVIQRFHFTPDKQFKKLLNEYNKSNRENALLACVGYANVKLRFCTRCFDLKKTACQDLYFINKTYKSSFPKIFCFGCVGFIIRRFLDEQCKENRMSCSLTETNV